ncbi:MULTISPECIES: response regulator transcription factor [Kocuria]|uniref:response regulator transcription factor n=1 Tax=Kocuria TaxID=57493 RepID=UPI0003605757|nr:MULTISPECIES: response regulator transcription factor [Kocuria]EYT53949.1 chemotaxis protein CheY [Kocuria sp. UCD-OTCP]MEB2527214.1 response regulator transcription factor [Kocuria rosea]MEB2619474.1 response regulator transcription factor [Kocuria rosea]PWF85346.1 DNA-binding response regulator [Kocuria rosea]WJZ66414.1 response regulator transcription factor [Kocuria rosea]
MVPSILLVEDDDGIALPLTRALEREQYAVERVSTGQAALASAATGRFPLVVLDLGLPDGDGLDVCRQAREDGYTGAVLILTARGSEIDRVVGLDVGADDYMAKPFSLAELLARVRALLRRQIGPSTAPVPQPQTAPGLRVDPRSRQAFVADAVLPVTAKEFDVLAELDGVRGDVVTREHLMDRVWDENWFGSTKTLDVTVARLRHKLADSGAPAQIVTVRGIGFRLEDGPPDA